MITREDMIKVLRDARNAIGCLGAFVLLETEEEKALERAAQILANKQLELLIKEDEAE